MSKTDEPAGLYCSTSGTYFTDKKALQEHYKSAYHQYNLKRKVAGLPPVTKEWFEARKQQLAALNLKPAKRVYIDPLTNKKFNSLKTYQNFVKSKKYAQLTKGLDKIPNPIVKEVQDDNDEQEQGEQQLQASSSSQQKQKQLPYSMKEVAGIKREVDDEDSKPSSSHNKQKYHDNKPSSSSTTDEESEPDAESDAESETDIQDMQLWPLHRSLFDNHDSSDMESNLTYMYKKYGFYLPDAEYLNDPEGLVGYLGAKLLHGHIPLSVSGLDPDAKRFQSLHAVQRHMIDTCTCRMLYDDNEDEYEDYYDYSAVDEEQEEQLMLIAEDVADLRGSGLELALAGQGGVTKYLGSREFSRYYKQKPRPVDPHRAYAQTSLVQAYKKLGLDNHSEAQETRIKVFVRREKWLARQQLRQQLRSNVNNNLPRNVPY